MADVRLVGAVAIRVRPDTSDFRRETQQGLNSELGRNGEKAEAKVKVDADTSKAEAKITKLEDEIRNKGVKLNVSVDYDGVNKAREQINQALKSLDNKVLSFSMNRESLAAAKRELDDLGKKIRVKMEYDKDEAGYKSILAKIARIRREQAKEVDVPISFHTDEASLAKEERKAKEAIARIQADKTVDIRYNDNYEGIRKAVADVDAMLEDVRKLKVETKLDEDSLAATKADLKAMLKFADVTIKFNEDKQGYETVLSRIKQIQREKLEKEITFSTDDQELRDQAAHYEQLINDANERAAIAAKFEPVTLEINEDLEGYKSALAHIKKLQREQLAKKITFNMDEKSLAKELAKYEDLVERATEPRKVEIKHNADFDSLRSALAQIDNELRTNWEIKIPVDGDTASLSALRDKLQAELDATPVEMKINEDQAGYASVIAKIKALQAEKIAKTVTFDTDDASLTAKLAEMRAKLNGLKAVTGIELDRMDIDEAKAEAKKLNDHISHMKASMQVELAGTALTAAQLAFLGRDRIVNYFARVSTASILAAEGMLKSLGGLNTFSSLGKSIESVFTKFDNFSLKVGAVATVLGNFANVGVYAATAAVRIGEGMVQSLGLLAAAPAVLGAATVGYTVFTAAFNNFFDAFNKDPIIAKAALAELPPLARKTVDSITGLYKGLANPIQERFWEKVGTTLSDAIEHLYPNLKRGLMQSTDAVGEFVAGFGRAMTNLSLTGDLDKMFTNFAGFFENLSGASEPFFNGWNAFGVKGSELLPRFGTWITNAATQFEKWATTAAANGQILDWIQHGVNSFQNMWEIGGSVVDMFKAIASAADLAGTGGLAQFNINMRKAADNMLGEPWQSRAATIFEGARAGASALNGGFKDLTGTLGESAVWLGSVLTLLGQIGGESLSRLSDIFASDTYKSGVSAELEGMHTLVANLSPAFVDLGRIIGNLGFVMGSVFSNMAPVINQFMALVSDATSKLSTNMADVAPKMLATVGGVLRAITPLVLGLADGLNGILGIVGSVPDSFIMAGVAATAFFALRALSSKFFESLNGTKTFQNLEANWLAQEKAAGRTRESFRMVNGEMRSIEVPTERYSALSAAMGDVSSRAGTLRTSFQQAHEAAQLRGLGAFNSQLSAVATVGAPMMMNGLKGLVGFLGGPWGIALMLGGALIGGFAQAQNDAKAHVEDLTASIDRQTGQLNEGGLEKIAKSWTDIGKAGDGWANLTRGAKAANETAEALALNLGDVTKIIAEGGPQSDQLVKNLDGLSTAMSAMEGAQQDAYGYGQSMQSLKDDVDEAGSAFGLSADKLAEMGIHAADVEHLEQNIRNEATAAALAKHANEELAKATGTTSIQAQQMATAMATIGDNSTTAASKIGAINKALDLLKGGSQSAREAKVAADESFQSAVSQAAALKEQLAGNNHLLDQTTKLIDTTHPAGLKLQQTMSGAANGIKIAAMAAYQEAKDAGKLPEEAMAASKKVLESHSGDLQAIADAAGVKVEDIQAEWDGFFGKEWELKAVFSASADRVQAVKLESEALGIEWSEQTYAAFLAAHNDPSKISVEQAKAWATEYAQGQYKAVLDALPQQALDQILNSKTAAEAYKRGDYKAVLDALNSTDPGIQASLADIRNKIQLGDFKGAIKVMEDSLNNTAGVQRKINGITGNSVEVGVKVTPFKTGISVLDKALGFSANGSIISGSGSAMYPGFGMQMFANGGFSGANVKMFANGGIENHVAQITKPGGPIRVWSEPETFGEAYIPLSAAKRNRSTQILAQVAQQFGYKLQKAQAFADGGVVAGGNQRATSGLQVHIGTFNQNANDTIEDVGRGIMRQARTAGLSGIMDGI
jgi:hypothetical protein